MKRLKVTSVDDQSTAKKAGVTVGDYLDAYDEGILDSTESLLSEVSSAGEGIRTLRIIRNDKFIDLECPAGRLGVSVEETSLDDDAYNLAKIAYNEWKKTQYDDALNNVILTTGQSLDGYQTEVVEIITAECAFGMSMLKDYFAQVSDVFGGRSGSTQKILRDARKTCLDELKREAVRVRANAVIAVDLDYSEFSGGGKSMLFLVGSGTAVKATRSSS